MATKLFMWISYQVSTVSDMGRQTEPIQAEVCVGLEKGM